MFRIFLSINSSFLKTQRLIWLLHKANTYAWSFWGRSTSGSSTISSSLNTALGNPIRNRVNPISNPSFNSMLEFMHSGGRHFSDGPKGIIHKSIQEAGRIFTSLVHWSLYSTSLFHCWFCCCCWSRNCYWSCAPQKSCIYTQSLSKSLWIHGTKNIISYCTNPSTTWSDRWARE